MAEEKITVIVAIYNKEKCLARCIESLLAQSYSNLQIILVDDDSFDGSGKICHEYADKDDRIIYTCHAHNRGISETRNTGIRMAAGKYIAFIDGDDFVLKEYIETLYKNLVRTDADISVCEYIRLGEDETLGSVSEERIKVTEYNDPLSFMSEVEWATAVVVWNKLYKTELFNNIRFPVNRIHQDEFIIHRIIAEAKKLVYTNAPRYVYVRNSESVMQTQTCSTYYDGYLALSDRITMLDENDRLEERDFWIQRLIGLLLSYYENSRNKNDSDVWKPVFGQRLMMLLRKYPECAALLDGGQRKRLIIILNA